MLRLIRVDQSEAVRDANYPTGKLMWKPRGFDNRTHYRAYLVFLLATILALNNLDGTALGLVLPGIKAGLHLTDTELGVLTGLAYSTFYATAGIWIARWADRGDRVVIIALTTALWGVMVMLVGTARSFSELLIVRIGVAVGEAGCVPAAFSLIGDYFSREQRPKALANYLNGATISIIVGYLGAGWLSYRYGWRITFFCIGAPSVIVAPVAWWTLSEPRRAKRQLAQSAPPSSASPSMLDAIRLLCRNRTFRYLLALLCINNIFGSGLIVWEPSFFGRSYGVTAEALGLYLAIVYGATGIIGNFAGGYLASRYAQNNERLQLRASALLSVLFTIVSSLIFLTNRSFISLLLLGVSNIISCLPNGPVFGAIQSVVPDRMRAISISIIYLFINLLGTGVGPLMVGVLSDAMHPYLGVESLRYALLAMCPGYFMGGWLLWQAARGIEKDIESALPGTSESSDARPPNHGVHCEKYTGLDHCRS